MPRIRSIKPEFWNDEKLGQEPESIMLTFIGLWNFSDDYGTVRAHQIWLKNQIYPYKDKLRIDVFSTWLDRLVELEAIILFTYKGESFYYIRTFRKHQKIDRPSKARNCVEEDLIKILGVKGYKIGSDGEFTRHSTSDQRVFDEYSLQDIGRDKDIGKEEDSIAPAGVSSAPFSEKLKEQYHSTGRDKKNVFEFIRDNRPDFIEPYVDLWNLFAKEKSFAVVSVINDARRKKFKVRIKEPAFKFLEILKKAGLSEFICTEGKWFSFDWIIENGSNYLKVIEGNYDNKKTDGQINGKEEQLQQKRAIEERTRNIANS